MSKRIVSIGRYYFLTMNLVILLTAVLSFGLAIQSSISRLDDQIALMSDRLLQEKKESQRIDLESAINLISLVDAQVEERYKKSLKGHVRNAGNIAMAYYHNHSNLLTVPQMQQELVEILRPYRFFDGEGYYFMFRPDGLELLYPVKPQLEGVNNLNWVDEDGQFFIQTMIDLVLKEKEGFVQYRIARPGLLGDNHLKESFLIYLPELDIIIGAGYYLADMTYHAQQEAADSLEFFGKDRAESFFGATYKGLVLVGSNRGINRIFNPVGNSDEVMENFTQIAKNGGGFLEYIMAPFDGQSREQLKISYILPYEKWEWYIETGSYINDLSNLIEEERSFIIKEVLRHLFILLIILIILYGLLFLLMRRVSKPVKEASIKLTKAMQLALEKDEPIFLDNISFQEFRSIAQSTNQILEEKQNSQKALFQKQKMEALGRLAGGVAHDINNQLTAVMGFADLIGTQDLDSEGKQFLESLLDGAHRASDMVRELLIFSRKQEGPKSAVDIHDILDRIKVFLQRTVDRKIQIRLEATATKAVLEGDSNKFYSMILNLALNSVDAMSGGGVLILTTRNRKDENYQEQLILEVRDNGCGIEKDNLEKIFELFFTTKPAGKGTGLGLALVYDIVREQQGKIDVESELNKGTLFTLTFPISGVLNGNR